jgi:hypothetical protein
MDDIAFAREIRRQRAFERLGSTQPACCRCGEDNPHCLVHISEVPLPHDNKIICRKCKAKASTQKPSKNCSKFDGCACVICCESDPRCLENHHIAGRKYDSLTVVVCLHCHCKLTDMQKDHQL